MKTRNYFLENLKLLKNSFKMHIYKNGIKYNFPNLEKAFFKEIC